MLRSRSLLLGLPLLVLALGLGAYYLTTESETQRFDASVSVADAMGGDTTGYRRATGVREFTFPRDHGPHPEYKNEWWYVTGNLQDTTDRRYGYELTIFRFAVAPPSQRADSAADGRNLSDWRTNQSYMAHFAVSNGPDETFYAAERFARGGAGLAGAQASPFRVWLEDWSMRSVGADTFPIRLQARTEQTRIDLSLRPKKPIVFQGDQGWSRKGPGPGNASYYYSYTRLGTEGTLVVGTDTIDVSGESWMDREWSTSALGPNQDGWDWFALQLDDGRDLMYYQLRNEDGSPSEFSEGTLVDLAGSARTLSPEEIELTVLDTWTSPDGTHTYPVEWQLQIPSEDIDVHIEALFPDQELNVSVRYWEGAVRVDGSVTGRGYVELTGYGTSASPLS